MSETYLVTGNTLLKISPGQWAAQSLFPLETHTLEYLDLQLLFWARPDRHLYEIYITDLYGYPTGSPISTGYYYEPSTYPRIIPRRCRFKMTPVMLYAGVQYAIVIRVNPIEPAFTIFWQYQADTGDYPRGRRLFSTDNGVTWTPYSNDDHIFGEFGNPPLPKPEPSPPIDNFALPDIFYTHWDIGLTICIPTSVPCHLICYYTDKKPLKHHTTAIVRGLKVPWDTYFCFVAWQQVEQEEEGDTLYHTFPIPTWLEGQTKWFTFKGEVDSIQSPSVGPIFSHCHPGGLPKEIIIRPNAPGDLCSRYLDGTGLPCPDHWQTVATPPPAQDDFYLIGNTINKWWGYDSYNIPDLALGKINKITHVMRAKAIGGYAYARVNAHLIRLNSTSVITTRRDIFPDWRYYDHDYLLNPLTSAPWTESDIDDLQIGVGLRHTWSVGWARTGFCSEVYLKVTRGINGRPY